MSRLPSLFARDNSFYRLTSGLHRANWLINAETAKQNAEIPQTASEESEPTHYKKFQTFTPKVPDKPRALILTKYRRGLHVKGAEFDKKKDYLTIDFVIAADFSGRVVPNWDLVRLRYKDRALSPTKIWSERREAQRDSFVKARLIFAKPNVPADLKNVSLIVPIKGSANSLTENLNGLKP